MGGLSNAKTYYVIEVVPDEKIVLKWEANEGEPPSLSDSDGKVREAILAAKGSRMNAQKILMAWAVEDPDLLRGIHHRAAIRHLRFLAVDFDF